MVLRGAQCTGEVRLLASHIKGQLVCNGAVFSNAGGRALYADGLTVDASMFLRGAQCTGEVRMVGVHIKGKLDCEVQRHGRRRSTPARFTNTDPDGCALTADGLTVDTYMFLRSAQCTGEVRLVGAHIGAQLNCKEAVLSNPNRTALNAEGLTVGSDIILRKAQCTGAVRLLRAHIGGQLSCSEAVLSNPNGTALTADGLTVGSDMTMRRKAQCTGAVRLVGAHIGAQLDCEEAVLTNPGGIALNAAGLTVGSDMILRKAQCTGAVRLVDVHVGGQLDCKEAVLTNSDGVAVLLEGASVGKVLMCPAVLEGELDLTRARVGAWHDEKKTWPRRIKVEGFVYDSIHAPDASIKDRLSSWLPRNGYLPQPYEQLAGVCRREGHEQAARAVAIGKQRARRADVRGWRRWPSAAWSAVLCSTIGYGYRPARALILLALMSLVGSAVFLLASQHPDPQHAVLHPAKPGSPEQPAFNSFRYTMDLLLPVVNFKQRDSFVAEGWAAWWAFGFTFVGWLLAAIVVAGLSGVFKRD